MQDNNGRSRQKKKAEPLDLPGGREGKSGLVLSGHKHTGMSLFGSMWSQIVQFHPTKSTEHLNRGKKKEFW